MLITVSSIPATTVTVPPSAPASHTLQMLKTFYSDVMRVGFSAIPATDLAPVGSLAAQVDAGTTTLAAADTAIARLAISTTSVANIAYSFFTGATPYESGLDYLVSPTGGNANNLNAAYYQSFNIENRYINFAVNLGKLGEGQTQFATAYGSLSLSDSLVKAYTQLFGTAPTSDQVNSLLNDPVPNGLGGTEARAQYFAYYGLDGPNGIGTKAAMIGWLMAEAVKEDVGTYALAEDALLADLGPDNLAKLHANLTAAYAPQPASPPGATLSPSHNQSVSPTSADPTLQSTNNADTITLNGLDAGQTITTGDGDDKLVLNGAIYG